HGESGGVGQGLDGEDLAEFFDDSGEHRVPCLPLAVGPLAGGRRGAGEGGGRKARGAGAGVARASRALSGRGETAGSGRAAVRACTSRRSRVLPPIRTFTVGSGIPPDPPSGSARPVGRVRCPRGSRTITAGSELHRPRSTLLLSNPRVCHAGVFPITPRPFRDAVN